MAAILLNPGIIDTKMLQVVFAESARMHEHPNVWAQRAVPCLLKLGAKIMVSRFLYPSLRIS